MSGGGAGSELDAALRRLTASGDDSAGVSPPPDAVANDEPVEVRELAQTKRNVVGVLVDAVEYPQALDRVMRAARAGEALSVSATAVHGVMEGVLDAEHRARLNELDLVTPDGQPVRWALNLLHRAKLGERVYGPTLMLQVCERASVEGLPVYLYGSTELTLRALQVGLERRFPRLVIAGRRSSRFGELDGAAQAELAGEIRGSGAAIVFVGLGCPRQEIFVHAMAPQAGLPMLAVGAAFDFHAGLAREAPAWMQRAGLQWVHRLAGNPRRLWKRYLVLNPIYMSLVFAQYVRLWRPAVAGGESGAGRATHAPASIPG